MHIYIPRFCRLNFLLVICVALTNSAFAGDHNTLWTVQGKHNTVYLLGSVHLLRASETMPQAMDDAYRNAKTLVMEIDMDDADPLATQAATMRLGLLPSGETLMEQLSADGAAKLTAYTQHLGIPTATLNPFRPWLAAVTLTQLHLMKLGLDPQSGIEQRLMTRAIADHKEILGFETPEEQLGVLAGLSPQLQVTFLLETLAEENQVEKEIDSMIAAWRVGDTAALEKILLGVQETPEIYRALIVDRNRHWLDRLDTMLADNQDYLVVVGAMHLVGKDSVVRLLEQRGYKVVQH